VKLIAQLRVKCPNTCFLEKEKWEKQTEDKQTEHLPCLFMIFMKLIENKFIIKNEILVSSLFILFFLLDYKQKRCLTLVINNKKLKIKQICLKFYIRIFTEKKSGKK